jgi:hypothetical protein
VRVLILKGIIQHLHVERGSGRERIAVIRIYIEWNQARCAALLRASSPLTAAVTS